MEIIYPSQNTKDKKEKNLYFFLRKMKYIYNNPECSLLSKKEIELCESIPGWVWKKRKKYSINLTPMPKKRLSFIRLKRWIIIYKRVPQNNEKYYNNYHYITKQYNKNKLSKNEIKKYESIPNWSWKDKRRNINYQSIETVKKIIDFYDKHKHWPKYHSENKEEKYLGFFTYRIRALYLETYKFSKITKEQIELLDSHPKWYWTKEDYVTLKIKEVIEEYKKTYNWIFENIKYRQKCTRFRQKYKKNNLTKKQIYLLESNNFNWKGGESYE